MADRTERAGHYRTERAKDASTESATQLRGMTTDAGTKAESSIADVNGDLADLQGVRVVDAVPAGEERAPARSPRAERRGPQGTSVTWKATWETPLVLTGKAA